MFRVPALTAPAPVAVDRAKVVHLTPTLQFV
jgi:hypothetical protein